MQESKYKTDIGGAILRGTEIEKPIDLAPSHFSPSLVVYMSPPQILSGREFLKQDPDSTQHKRKV